MDFWAALMTMGRRPLQCCLGVCADIDLSFRNCIHPVLPIQDPLNVITSQLYAKSPRFVFANMCLPPHPSLAIMT
eukprot:1159519-Pelagomonas_calceolata.AAC.21